MNFQTAAFNRNTFLKLLSNLSTEQLSFIPKGFNNHILWNIGHTLITEQMLTYGLSGLEMPVDTKFVKMYGKGSIPLKEVSKTAVEDIILHLIPAVQQTKKDFEKGIFKNYNEYPTSAGITLRNIEDAFTFNAFHEGIHLGIILAIKKHLN